MPSQTLERTVSLPRRSQARYVPIQSILTHSRRCRQTQSMSSDYYQLRYPEREEEYITAAEAEPDQSSIWQWLSRLQVFVLCAFPFVIVGGFVSRLHCPLVLAAGFLIGLTIALLQKANRR